MVTKRCLAARALVLDFYVAAVEFVYDYINEDTEEPLSMYDLRLAANREELPGRYDEGYDLGNGMEAASDGECFAY